MKTLASGWCPKHDRVFSKTDRCPECGTALIPLETTGRHAPPEEHRSVLDPAVEAPAPTAPRKPWVLRLVVAAALAGAFLLGLVFPRNEPEPAPAANAVPRETRPVEDTAAVPGSGTLRLGLLIQTGDRVTAVFSTVAGFPNPRLIEGAAVEVTTEHAGPSGATFSVSDVQLTTHADGFTITGRLDTPIKVVEVRITSIQVRAEQAPEWGANISSIWPVGEDEPKVLRLSKGSRAVAGGSVRLATLIGWRDRLEAVFELRGPDGSPGNRAEITGLELLSTSPSAAGTLQGSAIAASHTELVSAGQMIARFEGVSEDAGPIVIRAIRLLNFLAGPWIWRLG